MSAIRPGIYRHYKGKDYEVFGTARHSETLVELVVYRQLYGRIHAWWVRPLSMFREKVEVEGKRVPRFKFIAKTTLKLPLKRSVGRRSRDKK
jgi:hypothetical protein